MDEENKGLTIGQFFKIVFSRKWLALAVAAAITLVGSLALYFGYGKSYKNFEGRFLLSFQNNNSVYPDGTAFNVNDLISQQNLSEIRKLDSDFSGIDIEKMCKRGDISIYTADVEDGESVSSFLTEYTLKMEAKYFKNEMQAQKFAEYVINTPVRYIISIASDESFSERYAATDFYEEKIDLIKKRIDYTSAIGNMIENSGSSFKKVCKKLGQLLNDFSEKIDITIVEIRGEIKEGEKRKMIVHNAEEVKTHYRELIKIIESKLRVQESEFNRLTGDGKDVVAYGDAVSSRIVQLAKEMAENEELLETYKLYIGEGTETVELVENPGYVDTINDLNSELENYIKDFTSELEGYSLGSITIFKGEGKISLFASILISLVVGVVVAVIVAFCVGYSGLKKAAGHNKAESVGSDKTGDAPSSGE